MLNVNNLLILMIISCCCIPKVVADNTKIAISPVAQGIANYNKLAAPTDIGNASSRWIIYFGPTEDQAKQSLVAASKRNYVKKHSPLQAIPTIIVDRMVTWITLPTDPNQQINNSVNSANGTQTSSYGY
jgi:hypothetical protein